MAQMMVQMVVQMAQIMVQMVVQMAQMMVQMAHLNRSRTGSNEPFEPPSEHKPGSAGLATLKNHQECSHLAEEAGSPGDGRQSLGNPIDTVSGCACPPLSGVFRLPPIVFSTYNFYFRWPSIVFSTYNLYFRQMQFVFSLAQDCIFKVQFVFPLAQDCIFNVQFVCSLPQIVV